MNKVIIEINPVILPIILFILAIRKSVLFSIFLKPVTNQLSNPFTLNKCITLGICHFLKEQLPNEKVSIKWPNDLLIGDKKFAGMIAQATNKGVVLGIGINVGMSKEELPVENATSLSLEGFSELDRNTILAAIINHFEINLEMWENDKSFLAEYRAASSTIGNEVEVTLPDGEVIKSTAQNISDTGALLLANGREVTVGDVVHLR